MAAIRQEAVASAPALEHDEPRVVGVGIRVERVGRAGHRLDGEADAIDRQARAVGGVDLHPRARGIPRHLDTLPAGIRHPHDREPRGIPA